MVHAQICFGKMNIENVKTEAETPRMGGSRNFGNMGPEQVILETGLLQKTFLQCFSHKILPKMGAG